MMLVPSQMSVHLDSTEPLWYESMQDMSGFVLQDSILPPLVEQPDLNFSTVTENDFYNLNPGLPSPAEFFMGDHSETVIVGEDSDMFDNTNCNALNTKVEDITPESPIKRPICNYSYTYNTKLNTTMGNEERVCLQQQHEDFFFIHKAKVPTVIEKEMPRYLAIIDSEEPHIEEDGGLLYFTESKPDLDLKAPIDGLDFFDGLDKNENTVAVYCNSDFKDMGVAEEVVVITEEEKPNSNYSVTSLSPTTSDLKEELEMSEEMITEEPEFIFLPDSISGLEIVKESEVVFEMDPFTGLEVAMDNWFNDLEITDDLFSDVTNRTSFSTNQLFPCSAIHSVSPSSDVFDGRNIRPVSSRPGPGPKNVPQLTLDIDAAKAAFLVNKEISDTPELLEALKPEVGKFDLVHFITTNGDQNSNTIIPPTEVTPVKQQRIRKGKSHLSLSDLKQGQIHSQEKLSLKLKEGSVPLPSTSRTCKVSPYSHLPRKSATKFKKIMKEGLLCSVMGSQYAVSSSSSSSSDDDDDDHNTTLKAKRRRTISTSSTRRRLYSDSDQSSINKDALKYRERRNKNNLSSRRSRQKRKQEFLKKQKELTELEEENKRLRHKAEELQLVLKHVKAAWAEYLAGLGKDKDEKQS